MHTVTIEGLVEEIIYSNYQNGYTVCAVDIGDEVATATGYMPYLSEGETVRLSGHWTHHPEYGRQFASEYYEKVLPSTSTAILRYLGSGVIKGIRLATAKKIVDTFGDDSLTILMSAPQRLAEIKGISKSKAIEIGNAYAEQQGIQGIVMFLQQYGISPSVAMKTYRRFGADAVNYLKENPFILIDELGGVGFKTADRMALAMGLPKNSQSRLKAGVQYILSYNASTNGHTYLPFEALIDTATTMLDVDIAEAERAVRSLALEKQVYLQPVGGVDAVFLAPLYLAESLVARKLSVLSKEQPLCSQSEAEQYIAQQEQQMGICLAPEQRQAITAAMQYGVLVLTGGPGTGKTTIVNAIIRILKQLDYSVALAAPTGRAAKRARELTGMDAKTIHRLLEIGYSEDESVQNFQRDETNPLDEDIIIIDETSMVDISLASSLLRAIRPDARLIMVGDADQLPPVGPGSLLGDVIESGTIPTVRLTQIYRQARESQIVLNAHRIVRGEYPKWGEKESDFFFLARSSADAIAQTVAELCQTRLPNTYGLDPLRQIQVLSPMKKGPAGVRNLNVLLQEALNPPSDSKVQRTFGQTVYREGDKVMQVKNNYDLQWENVVSGEVGLGVFNGDMGFIEQIDLDNKHITILFDDDHRVVYDFNQIEEIEPAYAITVHKSQGSEFDVVVMPVFNAAPMLMRRNLFYTAVTRAKRLVVLVGRAESIRAMVDNTGEYRRFTGLRWRLENGVDTPA